MTGIRGGSARLPIQIGGERGCRCVGEVVVGAAPGWDPPVVAVEDEPGVWVVTALPRPSGAPGAPNARPDDARHPQEDHRPADGRTARGRPS